MSKSWSYSKQETNVLTMTKILTGLTLVTDPNTPKITKCLSMCLDLNWSRLFDVSKLAHISRSFSHQQFGETRAAGWVANFLAHQCFGSASFGGIQTATGRQWRARQTAQSVTQGWSSVMAQALALVHVFLYVRSLTSYSANGDACIEDEEVTVQGPAKHKRITLLTPKDSLLTSLGTYSKLRLL